MQEGLCMFFLPSRLTYAIQQSPANSAVDEMFTLGLVYYDLQNYPKAREMFTKLLHISSKNTEAMYQLARTMVKLRETQLAETTLRKLLKVDPGHLEARKLLDTIMGLL